MEKYCIVPKKSNKFLMFVRAMNIDETDRRAFQNSYVRCVEISPDDGTWEIFITAEKLIASKLLTSAAVYIKNAYGLRKVVFYQSVLDITKEISDKWLEISDKISKDVPAARQIISQAPSYSADGKIRVKAGTEFAGAMFRQHDLAYHIARAVGEITGCYTEVECEISDGNVPLPAAENLIKQTPEYKEALLHKDDAPKPSPAPGETRRFGRRAKDSEKTDPGCIYGRKITEDPVGISSVKSEMKSVVVAGYVVSVDGRQMKETNLLFFDIADDTDGISVKIFFKDKDEFTRVYDGMKIGIRVKVKGSVRFDTFQNDIIIFATGVEPAPAPLREDNAAEKRVELHAHTQLSAMDSVVSVKSLIKTAARWGHDAVAITDHGVVQAFPDAMKVLHGEKLDIKIIYGMEGYLTGDDYHVKHANHIIILAKNMEGLHNLYKLVSLSNLRFFHRQARIPKEILREYRSGLILGSACEAGELIRAIVAGKNDDELEKIADFYDYLEIQPIGNNGFLKRSDEFPNVKTDDDLREINIKVASLAKKLQKPLVATCDVHFLNPEDSIYRAVIMTGKGFEDADKQPPLFFRTTDEMIAEFDYLGNEMAYEAVVTNPRKIAAMVERIEPIPSELYSPMIPGADDEIRDMSYRNARRLYGEQLPKIVEDRLVQELTPIIGHGFSVLYLIAHRLVKKSNTDGYLVGSRGSVGSSFVATMTDITEVNPLPPHWRCPNCRHSEFITDGSYSSGFDLPDKDCPECGAKMEKDGHDIPFAVFLGFDGDKVPDIDLNFSGTYQPVAHKYTEQLFGKDNVYRAGTIATVAEKTAFGFAKKYYEEHGEKKRKAFIQRIVNGCLGTKRTTGQHPAGIMVVPRDMDVHFFTPIQHPADKENIDTITTHFDYHSISERLVKLDILGHDDPTVIKMLEDLTGIDPKTIPFDDPKTMSIFSSTEALGVTPAELGTNSGAYGIPEFRTSFTRQMIDDTHPKCFSDLVRISGFSHGTNVWLGNAQDLIRSGTCTLKDAISARDDIMMYLIHHGIEPLTSFKIMEGVRKGKGIKESDVEKLKAGGIPDWYIDSCQKIQYLFPRAHATAYVMMAFRIAYCKVHKPMAFYAAYFSIRADAFDANIISKGKEEIKKQLEILSKLEHPDAQQKDFITVLQLAWEMYLRGFSVSPVDLYRSDAEKFLIDDKSLIPPFTAMKGFGAVAAHALADAREKGPFTSVEDIKRRAGAVSKTNIELLKESGCLAGLPESDQMELF